MNANEVKQLRKQLGLTQRALADRLGVDRLTILRWENNQKKPPIYLIELLERMVVEAKWGNPRK